MSLYSCYLEEGALSLQSTGEVVGVSAAQAVAATCGTNVLAEGAAHSKSSTQCQLHVDESTRLCLINLTGPKSAVQVDLTHRQKTDQLVPVTKKTKKHTGKYTVEGLTQRSKSRLSSRAGPSVCPSPCWRQKQHFRWSLGNGSGRRHVPIFFSRMSTSSSVGMATTSLGRPGPLRLNETTWSMLSCSVLMKLCF